MSKKPKSQASSSRAASAGFGGFGGFSGAFSTQGSASSLTYVAEPPNLSQISEPQLVVAFKNLLKKDETTRSKALDDIKAHIVAVETSRGTLEDGFLEAWVKVYPRASIDNSRRVRQLAHSTQGSITALVGKRIARHLPKVIGAWLAGLYDNDRPVTRSASESFTRVFSTEDKRNNVWRIYRSAILEFVEDVILQQSPQTLSDERTVKPDDAEAKYARVAGTALLLFNRILGSSTSEDFDKDLPVIQRLLSSKSLWSLCAHEDAFVRRSVYTLLRSAALSQPVELDWKVISAAVIGKSLSISQIGSSSELSETLLQLTSSRPQLWTEDYAGKSSSSKRLLQYIQKGSQGGFGSFWSNLSQILRIVPSQVLLQISQANAAEKLRLSSATALTEALQDGLNSRDEPRPNLSTGWKCYVEIGMWLSTLIPEEEQDLFIQGRISPLLKQYVRSDSYHSRWTLPAQSAELICVQCFTTLAANGHGDKLQFLWTELSDRLLESVKLSSPEQSKDFTLSQDAICAQAQQLFTLENAVIKQLQGLECEAQMVRVFEDTGLKLLENCLQVLRTRNGKPYGAAAVVEEVVRSLPRAAQQSQELLSFVRKDVPELLFSASGDRLVAIVFLCREWDSFGSCFKEIAERVIQLEPEQSNAHILRRFLAILNLGDFEAEDKLRPLLTRAINKAYWPIVVAVLQNQTLPAGLKEHVFLSITDSLSVDDASLESLHGLSQVASAVPSAMREFQAGQHGSKLTGKLLLVTESPSEEMAGLAEELLEALKKTGAGDMGAKSGLEVLQHNLNQVNDESLSIESLFGVAEDLILNSKPEEKERLAKVMLPSGQSWSQALAPFLELPPRASTAIISPLEGTVHLVDSDVTDSLQRRLETVPRDISNCSSAFRLTAFVIRVLSSPSIHVIELLGKEELETLFYNLPLAVQLIEDDLMIQNCNGITGLAKQEQREEYLEVVHEGREIMSRWIHSNDPIGVEEGATVSSTLRSLWESKLEGLDGTSPVCYRVGEAFVKIMAQAGPSNEAKSTENISKLCKDSRTANAIRSASSFAVVRELVISNQSGTRLCNELVADSTGLKPEDERKDGLRKLVFLNLLISRDESVVANIPTQRLVFLVKHLIQCIQSDMKSFGLKAEITKTLTYVLPCLREIYGSHWEEMMEFLSAVWRETNGGDEALPLLAASFRLFACLRSTADGDCNDDLKDAWSDRKVGLFEDLTSTLVRFDSAAAFHQPRDVAVQTLCFLVDSMPVEKLDNMSELLPLLTANSRAVQRAAYEVLHRYIPGTQEQVSFDVALSKSAVHLPDELMSLLLEAPTVSSFATADNKDKAWADIRAYLLSWKLVFDHFVNASVPVQEYYVSDIKESGALYPLLEFMFEFLLKSHDGKLIDVSKFDVRSFELDQSDSTEKEAQWFLVHLYFLTLKNVANMTKGWWIDTKKRIKGPVEAWTEKFISPLIIDDALRGVSEWITTQDPNEDRALTLRVSPKTAEITASIAVDEESPPVAIGIALPPAYPLQPALVISRSRVIVDERKWKNWLVTIQGVIMFANGNLVDGLLAFRRNVQGALKGQSECAICYSVISTDMQTPNKRCATCKNAFHSVCLFRWFKSSNQSTCPLCRNNFVYV